MLALARVDWGRALVAALTILLLEGSTLLPLRARYGLAFYILAFVVAVVVRIDWVRRPPLRAPLLVTFAVSVGLPLMAALLPQEDRIGEFLDILRPTLTGWIAFLIVIPLLFEQGRSELEEVPGPSPVGGLLSLGAFFILLAVAHYLAVGKLAIISDEATYLAQARWMSLHSVGWELPPELARHFLMRKVAFVGSQMVGMYPPGWPALLALFGAVGLEWWSGVILGTISVWFIWSLSRRLIGPNAGWLAAGLLATSQVFLVAHAGYMAHAPMMFSMLGAAWCLVRGIQTQRRARFLWWMGAGVLFGYALTVRPLTGLTLGASVGILGLWRAKRESPVAPFQLALAVALGAVVPLTLFVLHNNSVFGRPLALGYQVLHPGLYDLGFGQRGFNVLDENAEWRPMTFAFSAADGVRFFLQRLARMNTTFVPVGLLLPFLAAAIALGAGIRWLAVGVFGILPLVHIFFWGEVLRLYWELLPFVVLGLTWILVDINARSPRAAATMGVLLVASQLIVALPWPSKSGENHRPWSAGLDHTYGRTAPGRWATLHRAVDLAAEHGQVVLFTREQSPYDNLIDRLYAFNGDRFDGPILVARDLGALNENVMSRFPRRVPYLVIDRGRDDVAEFVRIR
jgi:hypothetical protein